MKRLTYKGEEGPKKVRVPKCGEVERGQKLSVPDETAEKLAKQNPKNWERENTPKAEKPAAKPRSEKEEG